MAEHDLESLYREAQSALKSRDYVRASELLKQILVIDENYKDVSRLLAQTVKLKRRRWHNDPRLWGTVGVAVIIALGVVLAPKVSSLFTRSESIKPTVIVQPTGMLPPTDTPIPTETVVSIPTSIPLAWKRINIGQEFARDTVTTIAIDPKDADVLYASTENAGIYKSIDGGVSWRPAHHGLSNTQVESLLIDSQNPNILYAGTMDGIYKTEDGGENWSKIGTGIYLLMDPQTSSHLYARDEDGIYESTDQGKNWKNIYSTKEGCPDRIQSWAIHPVDSKILFIGGGEECESGFYLSSDGGKTWTPEEMGNFCLDGLVIGLDKQGNYYIHATCFDYSVFIPPPTFDSVYTYMDSRLYKENLNEEQRLILGKPDIGVVTVIAISPDDKDTLYVGGEGIAVSGDGGLTWTKLNNGLGSGKLQLYTGSGNMPVLYLQSGECDSFYTPNEGWDNRQSLYISTDSGSIWNFASQMGCHLIQDADGSTVYRIDFDSAWIWRSRDRGSSWEKVPIPTKPLSTRPRKIITFVAHPSKSGMLYAYFEDYGDGVLAEYFSEDYGHTWKRMDPATRPKPCYGSTLQFIDAYRPMAIDPFDGNHVLVVDNGTLLESHDSCDTTGAFATTPNTSMNSITFDPNNSDTIYAGTDGGAYVSTDGGQTWGQVNDGLLGATVVYSIAVDKDSNVYAATPYGVFKLEGK